MRSSAGSRCRRTDEPAPSTTVVFWLSELLARLVSVSLVTSVSVLSSVVTVEPVVRTTTWMVRTGPAGVASVPSSVG